MSNFAAESHSLPTFKERKAAKVKAGRYNITNWLSTDAVISEVYVDLVNGMTKSDVMEKLMKGCYENQKRPLKERTSQEYIAAAYQRMQYDFEAQAEEMRADIYAKLMSVYADAVKANDRYNAVVALDKIMKLTGIAMDNKPQNNIQINNNKEGITINFGFEKTDEN